MMMTTATMATVQGLQPLHRADQLLQQPEQHQHLLRLHPPFLQL